MPELTPQDQPSTAITAGAIPTREQILRLQAAMTPHATTMPEPGHLFAPGMYLRTLEIPAGMLIVGKTHKHDHFVMLLKGRALVVSEFGRDEVSAGYVAVSKAGVKRVVVALEDALFVTIHINATDTEDLRVIEAEHIAPDTDEMEYVVREVLV